MKKWILGAVIVFIAVGPAVLVVFTQIRYSRIGETEAETIVADYLDSRIEGNLSSALVIHCTSQKPMKVLWDCATVADALKSVSEGEKQIKISALSVTVPSFSSAPYAGSEETVAGGGTTAFDAMLIVYPVIALALAAAIVLLALKLVNMVSRPH